MLKLLSRMCPVVVAILCVSCGGDKPEQVEPAKAQREPIKASVQPTNTNKSTEKSTGKSSDAPAVLAPPKDARWTLACYKFSDPEHVARANQVKSDLLSNSTLRDWYVIHQEDGSSLYYGYYRTFSDKADAKEVARAQRDRQAVQSLRDQLGTQIFADAMFVPLDSPDPTAPPEWNLVNARGYWSVQIAAFQSVNERKEAAVDAVRQARAMGIEAYYYHGPSVSSVCIGAFPEEAVVRQEAGGGGPMSIDPDQPLMVLGPGADVPNSMVRNMVDPQTGKQIKVLEKRVEIADERLKAVMAQFPTYHVNNFEDQLEVTDPVTKKTIVQARPSFLVKIPNDPAAAAVVGQSASPVNQPNLLAPPTREQPGGRLRSVDK